MQENVHDKAPGCSQVFSSPSGSPDAKRQDWDQANLPLHQDLRKIVMARRIDDTVPRYGEEITTTPGRFCVSPIHMKFTAVLSPVEEGGFVALNPETGATTQGETVEEALANLKEARALYAAEFPFYSSNDK